MQTAVRNPRFPPTKLASMPRKKGPPSALRIDTPAENPALALAMGDSSASNSAVSPGTSDSESFVFPPTHQPRSSRNSKRLSLTLPSAQSSASSLLLPRQDPQTSAILDTSPEHRRRAPSVVSLPVTTAPALLRGEEEGSPSAPYLDGPIEILPKIWLGSEDNARNWQGLIERGIKSVLNVAKEVSTPFDTMASQPLRPFASTPNLRDTAREQHDTYYPAHKLTGRPGMHYLKLQWSHGQSDLVSHGFIAAMSFVDQALERGDGVLIHCQCGISRSATLVIGLVMRAAALRSPNVPHIWELKGMQGAYSYVKEKSKWVGPNMSLIYQLLEYERTLRGDSSPADSEQSSILAAEEEWGRRRQMLDESSDQEDQERESAEIMREARALDKAMEDRIVARKSSNSSLGSGIGMGPAWKSRYGDRKRAGSIGSNLTSNSILSEDLVEEDEEQELLGTGGGFDGTSIDTTSTNPEPVEGAGSTPSSDSEYENNQATPMASRIARRPARLPPSAPATKSSFTLPPVPATAFRSSFALPPVPPSATRSSFDLPPVPRSATKSSFDIPYRTYSQKPRRRPPPLGLLPPVPHSPIAVVVGGTPSSNRSTSGITPRVRTESRKPSLPPLHLRNSHQNLTLTSQYNANQNPLATPSQTLFVFPPSPTLTARTPSAMTLTSNNFPVPFPSSATPRVSKLQKNGRSRSFIGILAPPTPTTAHSRVDARGWFGDK